MSNKNTISMTEARKRFFDIAEEVQRPGSFYLLTEKGRPKVVLMSAEEYESWAETLEVMKDFPDLKKDVAEAERAFKSGAYKKWTTLDEYIAKQGFLVADKSIKKYAVSSKTKTKSRKRTK